MSRENIITYNGIFSLYYIITYRTPSLRIFCIPSSDSATKGRWVFLTGPEFQRPALRPLSCLVLSCVAASENPIQLLLSATSEYQAKYLHSALCTPFLLLRFSHPRLPRPHPLSSSKILNHI